jgi:heme-degrading monooxygenase HmoA
VQKVLIDLFVVPEESRSEFLKAAHSAQNFIKTLPGFVEGFLYEKQDGGSRYNVATTAVWQD